MHDDYLQMLHLGQKPIYIILSVTGKLIQIMQILVARDYIWRGCGCWQITTCIRAADNLKPLSKSWFTCLPCLLAMLTTNSGGAQELADLAQEEQILHHYAAMVKKDLEVYHAYSWSQEYWKNLFKNCLAYFIPANSLL